ncbi:sensor histidine kinase [Bosea sp. PAMC 26642]|uniref:sensor histidine kinase n=1 Tax=Bosea sp. (strain PAMC 26642) TaxID=1792307 RepID=UPI000770069B|nr:sensor histidine kinase [Bosea sp. PAMC 26642]AMJ61062.1 hypothetical protein AXW83_12870 [Bosea sp. PAMC 26642]
MRLSLGLRTLAITGATLLPVLGVLAYSEYTLRDSRQREVEQLALSVARQAAIELDRLAAGAEGVLQAIAKAPVVTSLNEELCTRYLGELKPTLPHFTAIGVFDKDGYSRCRSDGLVTTTSFGDRRYFQDALAAKGHMVIGEYTVSRVTGKPSLPFALAIMAGDNAVGVVVSAIDLDWLGASLRARKLADNASLTIADRNGTILAREPQPHRFVGNKIPDQFKSLLTADTAGTVNVRSQDGTDRVLGYVPVSEAPTGLYVSAGISRNDAFAAVNTATRRNLLIGLCAGGVSILLGWLLGNRLLRGPVLRISETIAGRRAGNEDLRTQMTADQGDIEALGAEIDAYMDELNRARVEREQGEQHRTMLTHELSHRVKNLLATVQAIASQTFRSGSDFKLSLATFNERLTALGNAQALLVLDRADAATVMEALSSATSVFEADRGARFRLNGPPIALSSEAALSLAMATHELCTNAVKYGALSVPDGVVEVDWGLSEGMFRLRWVERGGPPASPPNRQGFGSRMIERVLAGELGGKAQMRYGAEGFSCIFEAPGAAFTSIKAAGPGVDVD